MVKYTAECKSSCLYYYTIIYYVLMAGIYNHYYKLDGVTQLCNCCILMLKFITTQLGPQFAYVSVIKITAKTDAAIQLCNQGIMFT